MTTIQLKRASGEEGWIQGKQRPQTQTVPVYGVSGPHRHSQPRPRSTSLYCQHQTQIWFSQKSCTFTHNSLWIECRAYAFHSTALRNLRRELKTQPVYFRIALPIPQNHFPGILRWWEGRGLQYQFPNFVQTQFSVDAILISNQERGIRILAPPLSSGVSGKSRRLHSPFSHP